MTERSPSSTPSSFLPDPGTQARRHRRRMLADGFARWGMAVGGVSVIGAILMIFVYLLFEVAPLLKSPSLDPVARYAVPGAVAGQDDATLELILDEQVEAAARFAASGRVVFFQPQTGQVLGEARLPLPAGVTVTAHARGTAHSNVLAFGFSDGTVLVARQRFAVSYPGGQRVVTPALEFPLGPVPEPLFDRSAPVRRVVAQTESEGDAAVLAGWSDEAGLVALRLSREESLLEDEVQIKRERTRLPMQIAAPRFLKIDGDLRTLYVADAGGRVEVYDIADPARAALRQTLRLLAEGQELTALGLLNGDISLIAGTADGRLSQWFPVRDAQGVPQFTHIRDFSGLGGAIVALAFEELRKGFVAVNAAGEVGVFHATTGQMLLTHTHGAAAQGSLALAPRANALLVETQGGAMHFHRLNNPHPEISWSSLWGKVWYESYPVPDYVWQSSSANNDFEPKFSLVPLSYGTLKAALYALLVSIPLAILGAVYTAYFMAPALRQVIKPAVEIMGALPSVILGFLAGLWLAPALEKFLPGVFCLLLLVPAGCVVFAWFWQSLPKRVQGWVPEGWQPLLLIPVVLGLLALSMMLSQPVELWLFGGDVRNWLVNELHIGYDQRNAIVVGVAMGFAVIPTIFSIAEDAVFGVPKHLTLGSLALGATPWQTMTRVVILTASPGIFSAVMIGMGRAVGETMIVLMATGNTPTTDLSPFLGMRTLAANIAVELPESALGSSHYRVLILAALVLFGFTFLVNTVAEVVRHRLRRQYGSL